MHKLPNFLTYTWCSAARAQRARELRYDFRTRKLLLTVQIPIRERDSHQIAVEVTNILPANCAEVHHIIYLVMFITLALLFMASTFNQFTLNCYCLFTTFIKFIKMTPQLMLSHLKMTPPKPIMFLKMTFPPIKWPTNHPLPKMINDQPLRPTGDNIEGNDNQQKTGKQTKQQLTSSMFQISFYWFPMYNWQHND